MPLSTPSMLNAAASTRTGMPAAASCPTSPNSATPGIVAAGWQVRVPSVPKFAPMLTFGVCDVDSVPAALNDTLAARADAAVAESVQVAANAAVAAVATLGDVVRVPIIE